MPALVGQRYHHHLISGWDPIGGVEWQGSSAAKRTWLDSLEALRSVLVQCRVDLLSPLVCQILLEAKGTRRLHGEADCKRGG